MSGWARLRIVVVTVLWVGAWLVMGYLDGSGQPGKPIISMMLLRLAEGVVIGGVLLGIGFAVRAVYRWVRAGFDKPPNAR